MQEWRIDRYFADRIGLLDNVKATMQGRLFELEAP
jgi:hypothetical protein